MQWLAWLAQRWHPSDDPLLSFFNPSHAMACTRLTPLPTSTHRTLHVPTKHSENTPAIHSDPHRPRRSRDPPEDTRAPGLPCRRPASPSNEPCHLFLDQLVMLGPADLRDLHLGVGLEAAALEAQR